MLVTAFCVSFVIKLRWPKKKNIQGKGFGKRANFFLVTALPLPLNPCQLSVESNQAITLVLVLVLPGFEIA